MLGVVRFVLVAAPGFAAPSLPDVLRPEDLLGPPEPVTLRAAGREHRVIPRGRLRAADYSAQLKAARAGLGIARVPLPMVRSSLASGALVACLPDWAVGQSTIRCLHRGQRPLTMRLVQLIQDSPTLAMLTAG